MVISKEVILKSIDEAIFKCNSSSKARKIGATVTLSVGDEGYTLSYSNGMSLHFDNDNNMINLQTEAEDYPYLMDKCYDTFTYQKEDLLKSDPFSFIKKEHEGFGGDIKTTKFTFDNDWDFICSYADTFATASGIILNKRLIDPLLKTTLNSFGNIVTIKSSHDHFVQLERNNRVDPVSYVTLRIQPYLYESDNISKRTYTAKHHISMSLGSDVNLLLDQFGVGSNSPHKPMKHGIEATEGDEWRIYTTVSKDSGVNGLFLGNALKESPTRSNESEWETELNLAPNTKFVRDVIDEDNKIIIQHIEPK